MITMWIIIGIVAATVVWRLRHASAKLDRILRADAAGTVPAARDPVGISPPLPAKVRGK